MRVQVRAALLSFALAGCGDALKGSATGAMSGDGVSGEGTDASSGDPVTGGFGGSATSGATTGGGGGDPSASESGSGASGSSSSGTAGTTGSADASTGGTTEMLPPGIDEVCADGESAAEQVDMYRCGCYVQEGLYPDMEACLDNQSQDQLAPGCSCTIYAQHPDEMAFVTCYSDAVRSLAKCLGKMNCAEKAGQDLCVSIYFDELTGCGAPAKQTVAQIEIECGGAVPIACGSGEVVPVHWLCDGEADCADESDELDCFFDCGDGQLVDKLDKCDGEFDCMNGADEKGCPP